MKKILSLAAMFMLLAAPFKAEAQNNNGLVANAPFKMESVNLPQIPANNVSITDFGAVGNGKTLCTEAFQKAIETLSARGGGHLNVPHGVWLTGPIALRSHIDLHLEEGAIIRFAADDTLYPIISTVYEGEVSYKCQSPISGSNLTDISITGKGAIDGNGEYWRPVKRAKVTSGKWNELISRGGKVVSSSLWVPSESYFKGQQLAETGELYRLAPEKLDEVKRYLRPIMVSLSSCKRVLLSGVTFNNSPAWNVHPLMCEDLTVENVIIRNPSYAQNGDGIDIESCRNVVVTNSTFDTGDDAICLKSGKDEQGRKRNMPTENVIVDGCRVFHGHGGIVIGSEMSGGVRNVLVQNCDCINTDAGIRLKACRGRGGVVNDITIRNISMTDIAGDAITADLYYGSRPAFKTLDDGTKVNTTAAESVSEATPMFRDITIENVTCNGAKRAIFINGLPEMPITNMTLRNVNIQAETGAEYYFFKNLTRDHVAVDVIKK